MSDGVTHIETSMGAPKLADGVVLRESLSAAPGEAPGVTAFVHYNGPTDQLATMCMGMAVLAPGASPHPPHRHPEEEFMTVADGTGEIEVDGAVTQVAPGAVMYCAAEVLHGIRNTGSTPMTFYFSKWLGKTA